MPEDIALFIDFENIRYSMLNIQRREPDPQELIAVARRYGTVMVARAYADWSRQPEPFKGSLTAAMIDRVDCPAKQRDRIRMGTIHYANNNPTGPLGSQSYVAEQNTGSFQRPWSNGMTTSSGSLPAINPHQSLPQGWPEESDTSIPPEKEEEEVFDEERIPDDEYTSDYQQREAYRTTSYQRPYDQASQPTGPLGQSYTGPLGYPTTHTGTTGHMPAVTPGNSTIVQSTVVQSTVDLNMLMDIIETVFDRPTISTFVLMTGDKDFTRISARLKLRLNKNVIVVGIPGTVSRDLISSANQFVPLVPGGTGVSGITGNTGSLPVPNANFASGSSGSMPAVNYPANSYQQAPYGGPAMDVLDPLFVQFLDYIDRNWSWRTIIGVSNFIGDPVNPKNRFRGRLTRESARELLNTCVQQGILLVQTDATGAEDLRLNRTHPGVDEVLKQFVR
ncbi:NYN domain-containing protein [Ktedonospora formicarum]|uniref:NYN domain-containing protein n=1 Tax=Ktedonospora formicarum TaxID=2778364 RepID=A0A8J3HUL2_9CHLR|nr:NYN domain-containing protein [Ktedonospora formicarum]GHO43566.1 hypothetical protein KSX_17290 [Ktedonospora formicarum]